MQSRSRPRTAQTVMSEPGANRLSLLASDSACCTPASVPWKILGTGPPLVTYRSALRAVTLAAPSLGDHDEPSIFSAAMAARHRCRSAQTSLRVAASARSRVLHPPQRAHRVSG